jgi:hypothetical protein
VGIGVATDNLPVWIAVGTGVGLLLGGLIPPRGSDAGR